MNLYNIIVLALLLAVAVHALWHVPTPSNEAHPIEHHASAHHPKMEYADHTDHTDNYGEIGDEEI